MAYNFPLVIHASSIKWEGLTDRYVLFYFPQNFFIVQIGLIIIFLAIRKIFLFEKGMFLQPTSAAFLCRKCIQITCLPKDDWFSNVLRFSLPCCSFILSLILQASAGVACRFLSSFYRLSYFIRLISSVYCILWARTLLLLLFISTLPFSVP